MDKKLKAILVDDEKFALETLEWDIQQYCPEIEIIALESSPLKAIKIIKTRQPDLVFLDIEMPHMNAFELLEELGEINFDVIFCTAYDQYAIRAFKVSAVDYLLKPVNKTELQQAVQRIVQSKSTTDDILQLKVLLENFRSGQFNKLTLNTVEGMEFVEIENILYCRSDSNYTRVYLRNQTNLLVSKTLKDVEELLQDHSFYRTHHSYLVNLHHVQKYLKRDSVLVMSNSDQVSVSRSRKEGLLSMLK